MMARITEAGYLPFHHFVARFTHIVRATSPIITLAFVFAACSGGGAVEETVVNTVQYRYAPTAEMSAVTASTALGDITVRAPSGWVETMDQKNAPHIALWLVKEDYSASISFSPLQMDPVLYSSLKKTGLRSIAKVSLSMKKDNAHDTVTVTHETEYFRMNDHDFAAYEYTVDGGKTVLRIVVFDTGTRFMECALLPATAPISGKEALRYFETQQSVLASMVLR